MASFGKNYNGFFGSLVGGSAISGAPYGSFYDTTNQTATLINTAYAMKLNTSDSPSTSGVVITNDGSGFPTQIKVNSSGIYNLQFSAQWLRTLGGASETIDIWLRKNSNTSSGNISNSNTHVSVQANLVYLVTAWNFFVSLTAGDYIQLVWATTSTDIQLAYDSANALHPATPSLIVTINKVS